jgi:hypothetical protein
MLSPDARSLYTVALTPPPGFIFDAGIATTFSLDPSTLLTVPLHLALLGRGREETMLRDPIALLEALRRTADKVTVYAQEGRILVPGMPHILYSLLENVIREVRAPNGGSFHPKLWALRFLDPLGTEPPFLRLVVLSRNLTADRCWDLALQLEGRVGRKNVAECREIGEFVTTLPELCTQSLPLERREAAERLGEEIRRTRWEVPPGFEQLRFHVLGRTQRAWRVIDSDRLAVISPFLSDETVIRLAESTKEAVVLVSRPESLAELELESRARFARCMVLHEAVETEDGEALEQASRDRDDRGLHAKAIVLKRGWDTHLFVGSANCTAAAFEYGRNVELMVELIGKGSQVGTIDALLGPQGLQSVLTEFVPPGQQDPSIAARKAAEKALDVCRLHLAQAGMRLVCQEAGNDWRLSLTVGQRLEMTSVRTVRTWPLSIRPEQSVDASALAPEHPVELGRFGAASLTGLVAFELTEASCDLGVRFALNLPVEGLPEERDTALLRTVIRNRDGFLRYLMLLLGEFGEGDLLPLEESDVPVTGGNWGAGAGDLPLLEELTRAFSRRPERLHDVGRVLARLSRDGSTQEVVPEEFLELWTVFTSAMESDKR